MDKKYFDRAQKMLKPAVNIQSIGGALSIVWSMVLVDSNMVFPSCTYRLMMVVRIMHHAIFLQFRVRTVRCRKVAEYTELSSD